MTDDIFDVARKNIYWLIAGFIIVIVILAFVFTIAGYRNKLTKIPPELRAELISLRFASIPDCFAVSDENTGAVLTDTVDLTKFTKEAIDKCYRTEQEKGFKTFNFRLQLKEAGKEVMTNNYFHQDDFTLRKAVRVWDKKKPEKERWKSDQLIIYVQEKI